MMQEVSVKMAYNAQLAEEMSEEEILACLVAETEPHFTVPTKKAQLRESRLQIMDDEEEDPLEKYLEENQRLQQTSLRLEQENDNLAHRLISSKVALRSALDQAEDQIDQLSKDLYLARHQQQATQDQMRRKEEESAMLKDVLRRELEKAEQDVQRSSGIIADYKQICSQLTERLERQQATHRQEIDSIKKVVKACRGCSHVLESMETSVEDQGEQWSSAEVSAVGQDTSSTEKESLRAQIRELEQELAQTKLQMVEAKCRIQELEHETGVLNTGLQEARNNWLSKALTSLRSSSGALHLHDGGLHSGSETKEAPHIFTRAGLRTPAWSVKKISWPHRDHQHNE